MRWWGMIGMVSTDRSRFLSVVGVTRAWPSLSRVEYISTCACFLIQVVICVLGAFLVSILAVTELHVAQIVFC